MFVRIENGTIRCSTWVNSRQTLLAYFCIAVSDEEKKFNNNDVSLMKHETTIPTNEDPMVTMTQMENPNQNQVKMILILIGFNFLKNMITIHKISEEFESDFL
jgi:hypothetical protein